VRFSRKVLVAAVGIVLGSGAAFAADPPPVVVVTPTPVVVAAPVFDWSGVTVGVLGRYEFCGNCLNWTEFGLQLGYDRVRGNLLVGAEVSLLTSIGDGFIPLVEVNGRAGFVLGRAVVYAEAGLGTFIPASAFWTAGLGAEVAVGSRMSVFAEFKTRQHFTGSPVIMSVGGGLRFHFGG
jgi:opacity protein-like surface antigen